MKLAKCATLLLALGVPVTGFADNQWSACQTVTGVTNYLGYNTTNPSVAVALSPGIPNCNVDAPGAISFALQGLTTGSTVDTLKTLLATLLSAQASGTRVMILYDAATCRANAVSVGGYAAQCP
ncbi:hypothetical protein GCM10011487_52540 [Steroidobacter agaridevorans]|uniref:Uncharacterized protein n=1 Tax=Steroidobacter agaridevorans TaxID=2695856 RepID=A0A829YIS0_9GAMM|nr:hypothetical protein [Steroidobacter agaridevorans]GFE83254.1 hypothetical protein GCM10011487_52540 [Steroidobacter agaridevorans]GFE86850.1 hypothetical protein GCM10011488_18040 [Steroidobacter agaridevorans]